MKKRIIKIYIANFILCLTLIFVSCMANAGEIVTSDNPCSILEDYSQHENDSKIVLGEKIENPFSLKSSRMLNTDEKPNYFYFRIRTMSLDALEQIKVICGDLNIIPYDYKVIKGGTELLENSGDDMHSPWYYYVLPSETLDLLHSDDYEIEILDEMYLTEQQLNYISGGQESENQEIYKPEDINSDARFLWFNWASKVPSGYVYAYDEVTGRYEPVPNVKVTVTQWCFTHSAYTDENGYYNLGVTYTTLFQDNALVTVWFENENEDVMYKHFISTSFYNFCHINVKDLSNNNIYLKKGSIEQKYGNIIRAAELYRKYIKETAISVTNPEKLKIWAVPDSTYGITLMGNEVIGTQARFMSAYISLIVGGPMSAIISTVTASVLSTYIPDLIIGCSDYYNNNGYYVTSTETVFGVMFHELSHASHYKSLGMKRVDYWATEYTDMLFGWIEIVFKGLDPFENCYNNGNSDRVCFIESWGYFFGDYLMDKQYGTRTRNNYKQQLASISFAKYSYFYNQAYYQLLLQGYSIKDIFYVYRNPNIASAGQFIDEFSKIHNLSNSQKNNIVNIFRNRGAKL